MSIKKKEPWKLNIKKHIKQLGKYISVDISVIFLWGVEETNKKSKQKVKQKTKEISKNTLRQ